MLLLDVYDLEYESILQKLTRSVVIVGGGFCGLKLVNKLKKSGQVVLITRIPSSGLPRWFIRWLGAGMEPTLHFVPFRKIFQHWKTFIEWRKHAPFSRKEHDTLPLGKAEYDYFVLAVVRITTNFFGNSDIEEEAAVDEAERLQLADPVNVLWLILNGRWPVSTKQETTKLLNIVIRRGTVAGEEVTVYFRKTAVLAAERLSDKAIAWMRCVYLVKPNHDCFAGMFRRWFIRPRKIFVSRSNRLLNSVWSIGRDHKVMRKTCSDCHRTLYLVRV